MVQSAVPHDGMGGVDVARRRDMHGRATPTIQKWMMNNGKGANMKNDNDVENTEDAEVVCPYCGSRNIARIFRGTPTFTEELQRELDEGKVVLGGCEVEGIYPLPRYQCNDCEEEF
jgi:hypothetical protein